MSSIVQRMSRVTGAILTVGPASELGVAEDDGLPWAVVCEPHSTLVFTDTKRTAMTTTGLDFCDDCRSAGATTPPEAITTRISRATGTSITVANVAALGVTPDGDRRWLITCDEHDTSAYTRTKRTAMQVTGLDFCAGCREMVDA